LSEGCENFLNKNSRSFYSMSESFVWLIARSVSKTVLFFDN